MLGQFCGTKTIKLAAFILSFVWVSHAASASSGYSAYSHLRKATLSYPLRLHIFAALRGRLSSVHFCRFLFSVERVQLKGKGVFFTALQHCQSGVALLLDRLRLPSAIGRAGSVVRLQ